MKSNTKEAYYFSHDSNARNDEKILAIRMRHKTEGYGVYFMILERLRECKENMSIKDYNVLAFDFRVSADLVKSVVEDFGLFVFTEDGKHFYSERMQRNMKIVQSKSEKARQAVKKRWEKQKKDTDEKPIKHDGNTDLILTYNDSNTIKQKEIKRNKTKEDEEEVKDSTSTSISDSLFPIETLKTEYLQNERLCNAVISNKQNKIRDLSELKTKLTEFVSELEQRGHFSKKKEDFQTHFRSWARKRFEQQSEAKVMNINQRIPLAR